jgi:hypothetical protein
VVVLASTSVDVEVSSHVCVAGEHTRPVGHTPSGHGAPGFGRGE